MTPFTIEHEFRAASLALYWQVYLDEAHVALLDEQTGVAERTVLERREDDDILVRRMYLERKREIPALLRSFVKKQKLGYDQTDTFYKRESRVETEILPSVFAGRSAINFTYTVRAVAPGRLLRTIEGTLAFNVPIAGSRIEKAILEDMRRSYEVGTELMQKRLDEVAAQQCPQPPAPPQAGADGSVVR